MAERENVVSLLQQSARTYSASLDAHFDDIFGRPNWNRDRVLQEKCWTRHRGSRVAMGCERIEFEFAPCGSLLSKGPWAN